ncbi:MAG: Ig-like domain-containing protein, partial [Pirellulales bacterium]
MTNIRTYLSRQSTNVLARLFRGASAPRSAPRRRRRDGHVAERLEPRALLDATGLVWSQQPYLTASFVPDGTDVNGRPSELTAAFSALADETEWQATILRAFQTWAVETNADVGVVPDSGDPLGTPGVTHRDPRFGDVRIAAVPLPLDVLAVSVPNETIAAGTWVGDVLLNSAATWNSLDDLYSVALHEAGHVFTLPHSADPLSPMFVHGVSANITPIASDIAALQQRYGARVPDANEGSRASEAITDNDTLAHATQLNLTKTPGHDDGAGPSLVYGDITTVGDVDFFFMPDASDYDGQVTFALRSDAISLLAPKIRIFNEDGVLLAEAESDYAFGDYLTITLDRLQDDGGYYIAVSAAVAGPLDRGGYSLVATWDGLLQSAAEQIDAAAGGAYRFLSQEQLQDIFEKPGNGFLNDDGHDDDDRDSSAELETSAGFLPNWHYDALASISDASDLDFYKIKSPETLPLGPTSLYVSVQSVDAGRLWPRIRVYDEDNHALVATTLVDGGGDVVVQVSGVVADTEYFVSVDAADRYGLFTTGNYRLAASFGPAGVLPQSYADGTLTEQTPDEAHTLFVGRTQMFHFLLSASATASATPTSVWAVLHDADGNLVHSLAAPTGTTRSGASVVLAPGEYNIALLGLTLDGSPISAIDYSLSGLALSEPVGPDPQDPTGTPNYICPDNSGAFCYPDGATTLDPFVWSTLPATLPNFPTLDAAQLSSLLLGDWWSWVWTTANANPLTAVADEYSVPMNATFTATPETGVLSNDPRPLDGPLAALLRSTPAHGTLTLAVDGSFVYQPEPGFQGTDQFVYATTDFRSVSSSVVVTLATSHTSGLVGDLNADGRVDLHDLILLHSQFGMVG